MPSWCTKHNVMISVSRSQPFLCRCGSISSQKEKGWWLILWFFFSSQKLVSCELLFTGLKGLLLVCELLLRNRCLLVSCLCFCLWEPHRDVFHFMLNCHLMLEFFVSKAFLLWNKAEKVQIGGLKFSWNEKLCENLNYISAGQEMQSFDLLLHIKAHLTVCVIL